MAPDPGQKIGILAPIRGVRLPRNEVAGGKSSTVLARRHGKDAAIGRNQSGRITIGLPVVGTTESAQVLGSERTIVRTQPAALEVLVACHEVA